ncbi:MAG: hypothetical protein N2647_01510 [Thermodesulfovibrio sp.]|nr:hypothetical protein [Thermodesulfovibrio sp.]
MNNLERILFSLIVTRLDGYKISDSSYIDFIKRLVRDGIGGFILFGGKFKEVKNFLSFIQSISSQPLIIASDIEKGVGQQIKGGTIIPSQMGIVAGFNLEKDKIELEVLYSIVSNEALDLGINLALIPVLDVNTEKSNPIICTRAFSDDPYLVSEYGKYIIKFFQERGLKTCGKHFPGHGSTKIDSHLSLPVINEDISLHIKPFKEGIKEGVSSIMIGHLMIPQLDDKPATLSEKIIHNLLRRNLGFKGLVFTDAMNMKALRDYSFPHALALKAGADVILHPEDPYEALEEIILAYNKGLIEEIRIKEANERLKSFRNSLTNKVNVNFKVANDNFLINNVFKKTITVIKKQIDQFKSKKIIPYLVGAYNEHIKRLFENHFGLAFDVSEYKKTKAFPLIALFTDIKAAGMEYGLKDCQTNMVKKIISNNNTILVSFGNPYIITNFSLRKAKTIVLVYDSNEYAVKAFLDSFNEELQISGKLPIKLNFNYE